MFGDSAVSGSQNIGLIIYLKIFSEKELFSIDRLHGMYTTRKLLDCDIPEVTIPVAPGRNLATLVEAAVRNQLLKIKGYVASADLIMRQREKMEK
jgi:HPr kinase/phosphorylase